MITIGAAEVRGWLGLQEARLRRALPSRAALEEVGRLGADLLAALRREVDEARASRPRPAPLRDAKGRRLRASAHRIGAPGGFGPRQGGGNLPPHRRGSVLSPVLKAGVVCLVGALAFLGSSFAYIDFTAALPDVHAITAEPLPEDTIIYAADGSVLADLHPEGIQHYYQPLSAMGRWLPEATVATEDANFWNEPGIDPAGIARAAWVDWRHRQPVQGASTITQQLVKLRLTGNQPTFERKLKEAILALQLEHTYTKQQILEQYLNTIHYSNNAQGSLAAARIYFRRDTKDLDLAQAAMLAGIPQSPFYNDPFTHWENAKARQREVLQAMVHSGYISQEQADRAYAEDLRPPAHMFKAGPQVLAAPGFVEWVTQQLVQRFGQKTTLGGGLRVHTTLDPRLQAIAENAVVGNVNNNRDKGVTQGAMVAIDPRTGAVLAMVGSDPSGPGHEFDFAVWPPRNPGSSMKLWTYTAAIESGKYTMVTPVVDSPIAINAPGQEPNYRPQNYDGRFHGVCEVQKCLGNSLNVPAVKVEISTGIERVVDVARRVGAPPWFPDPSSPSGYRSDVPAFWYGASLTLGGYGETPLQQATGAATLAALGVYHQPYGIAYITTADGRLVFKADPARTAKQVVDPRVAFIMATMLSDDNNRAMIFGRGSALTLPNRRVAAKTGTTDDFKDAWTVGFTPSLASAFWFGDPQWRPMQRGFDAVYAAAPAWHVFMDQALNTMGANPSEWFAPPAGLTQMSWGGRTLYLLPGTAPWQAPPPLPSWASSGQVKSPSNSEEHD